MSFIERVTQFFKPKPQIIYKIVEVKRQRTQQKWDENTRAAVQSLQYHPGFLALVERLETMKDLLDSTLKNNQHRDLREVDNLQIGSRWCGFVLAEVTKPTLKGSTSYLDPLAEELEAFKKLDAQIERVGTQE